MTLDQLLPLLTFQAFLLFCRLGAAVFVFPAFSDASIPPRTRLILAIGATLVMLPLLQARLPLLPPTTSVLVSTVAAELVIGLMLGLSARLFMSALSFTGELIGFMAGFQSASLFDPQSGASTAAPTVFLTLTAGLLILAFNLHHLLLQGVAESYAMFPPGQLPPINDTTQAVLHILSALTKLGVQLAAPVVIAGLLINMAFGVFNRLIPQIQVFFISVPASIILSLLLLAAALTSIFALFIDTVRDNMFMSQIERNAD